MKAEHLTKIRELIGIREGKVFSKLRFGTYVILVLILAGVVAGVLVVIMKPFIEWFAIWSLRVWRH